ncbi:MAG: hypothetical protein KAR23_00100 [Candidatus Aenigmarchaeota archaeon]|nr:hypothetical protein [Candidatus Aenigmarchaeota archaeon]
MNKDEMTDNEKPILTADDLISIMLRNVHLMKKDENFQIGVIIGPDFEGSDETKEAYDYFYGGEPYDDISYIKDTIESLDPTTFTDKDDLRYVLEKLKELPQNLKVYSINYDTSLKYASFNFFEKEPRFDPYENVDVPGNCFSHITDPVLKEIEDNYQPLIWY